MSLNGDVMVIRNGRSTSTVSIYNYPEHLNPFYEDDQHKRLRFWHINKKGDGERRNSFSLGGIKDMWAFKSFRSKKKSSTLGINKTSESPPMLRREYQIDTGNLFNSYDRRARYSSNGTTTDGSNNNFQRNATYRSSLQNMHSTQDSPSGFGLNRNDQYRSTTQFGGRHQKQIQSKTDSRPVPQPRRYVYGGSVTPQPSRNSEFGRGLTRDNLTLGSSQNSVSTNPFDSDDNDEEETEQHIESAGGSIASAGKRTPRKKRRAPAPPVPVHSTKAAELSSQTNSNPHQTELRIEENLDIANLNAEIQNLVNSTNDDLPAPESKTVVISETVSQKEAAPKTNGTIPKEKIILKTSPNMVITKGFKSQSKSSDTDLCITEDNSIAEKPVLPEKKKINKNFVVINREETVQKENLDIANLSAEIQSFVNTNNDDLPEGASKTTVIHETAIKKETAPKTNGTIPKEKIILKTSPNMVITKEFKPKPKSSDTDLCIMEDDSIEVKQVLHENKKINKNFVNINKEEPVREVGHVECIHVHVESPRSTPERTIPSRVTSFKKEPTPPAEQVTAKTGFTLASPPTNRREVTENGVTKQKITVTETVTSTGKEENGIVKETPAVVKPPIPVKTFVESPKPKVTQNFAVIHKPSRRVVLSSETEEIAVPQPTTVTTVKTITTEQILTPISKQSASPKSDAEHLQASNEVSENVDATKIKAKLNPSQKHVVFQTDEKIREVVTLPEIDEKNRDKVILPETDKVAIKKPEISERTVGVVSKSVVSLETRRNIQTDDLTTTTVDLSPAATSLEIVEPTEDVLKIEEPNSHNSNTEPVATTSNAATQLIRSTPRTNPRDEFEALYRNRPGSHLEWKQSTLAPLEPHVPPEKRRSVKDIIESINRSQRLLHAAANKDLPLLSTTSQMPPPAYSEVVNQPHINSHKDNDFDQSLKSLDETQREIERMFQDITAEDNSDEAPSPSYSRSVDTENLQKPNNNEIFKKCRVTKEVYDYRETSPTTSNLDWNPVPKPKRSKNLSDQKEH